MQALKAKGVPFAMATVVRTVNATSAKPGGKALLDLDGKILMGWVGGGCARGAVGKAAREAIKTGEPQFISLRPQELLKPKVWLLEKSATVSVFRAMAARQKGPWMCSSNPFCPFLNW